MSTVINADTVRHIAELARLRLTEEQIETFAVQLARILDHVAQLNELDTAGVPPTAHPSQTTNVFRDDVPHESWSSEAALHNAPQSRDGFFQVPKVLD
ncbi:MAG: Asp-tRNA(Asn)/Glu-tRNA(Gln) amidotransferase subunit GatC, partial [Planctomycetota bacterium]